MFLALYICVLFISLMQSLNEAQLLNTTSLPTLSGSCTLAIVIVLWKSEKEYMHHYNHINWNLTLKF